MVCFCFLLKRKTCFTLKEAFVRNCQCRPFFPLAFSPYSPFSLFFLSLSLSLFFVLSLSLSLLISFFLPSLFSFFLSFFLCIFLFIFFYCLICLLSSWKEQAQIIKFQSCFINPFCFVVFLCWFVFQISFSYLCLFLILSCVLFNDQVFLSSKHDNSKDTMFWWIGGLQHNDV